MLFFRITFCFSLLPKSLFINKNSVFNVCSFNTVATNEYELNEFIKRKDTVLLANFDIQVVEDIVLDDNTVLIFQPKTRLIRKATKTKSYNILKIHKIKNITIFSPNIVGERYDHIGDDGEWGMGIGIRGSENVKIFDSNISNCWGDGIYIGRIDNICSRNIEIINSKLTYNRRNNISITCGELISIKNVIIKGSEGTNPMAGIDIEPNSNKDDICGVLLENIQTFACKGHGVVISLGSLIGVNSKTIEISLKNITDNFSKRGLSIGLNRSRRVYESKDLRVNGSIDISNVLLNNSKKSIEIFRTDYHNINFKAENIKYINDGMKHKLELIDNDNSERIRFKTIRY